MNIANSCELFILIVLCVVYSFITNAVSVSLLGKLNDKMKDDLFNIYQKSALFARDSVQKHPVTDNDVTFYLYTNENPSDGAPLGTKDHLDIFRDTKSPIIFLIHGWLCSVNSSGMQDIKNAFLTRDGSSMVFVVDWKGPASQDYYVASISTSDIASIIGDFIVNLNQNYGVPEDSFLIVGHSLGAQISGFIGKIFQNKTGEKLPRIIGLDPAGPLFTQRPSNQRLNPTDARVVQVVHSDTRFFGFKEPSGTIDFFVNGGSDQPGCGKIEMKDLKALGDNIVGSLSCNHRRSEAYFTEAVLNPIKFVAQKCHSWSEFTKKRCGDTETVAMGDLDSTLSGNFYLTTGDKEPFWDIK